MIVIGVELEFVRFMIERFVKEVKIFVLVRGNWVLNIGSFSFVFISFIRYLINVV